MLFLAFLVPAETPFARRYSEDIGLVSKKELALFIRLCNAGIWLPINPRFSVGSSYPVPTSF
jgi:hypothetical protein